LEGMEVFFVFVTSWFQGFVTKGIGVVDGFVTERWTKVWLRVFFYRTLFCDVFGLYGFVDLKFKTERTDEWHL